MAVAREANRPLTFPMRVFWTTAGSFPSSPFSGQGDGDPLAVMLSLLEDTMALFT